MNRRVSSSVLMLLAVVAAPAGAATLLAGFGETLVASGLSSPTAMEFAPDGRIFVCQQGGSLRVIKNGTLLATPFVTVTTDPTGERGLLGIAFDPNFASNQYVYVYYTVPGSPPHNRVSRFTAQGDVAAPGSELAILDLDNLSSATNHNGGAIHFGPDGKLYVAVGENANASNAQSFTNRLGKMLRINADGTIPGDNPSFGGQTTGANRAIWALGLRNPFTFGFHATSGRMFINDVGQNAWEEINDGIAGSNYGWPILEGNSGGTPPPDYRAPLLVYPHGGGTSSGCAIVGAAFYDATTQTFPAEYANDYFFGDLCNGWIRRFDPVTSAADLFATGISSLVDLNVSPDGSLYYLVRGSGGAVFQVQYRQIRINDVAVSESGGAATFTVSLTTPSTQTVTVSYATADGSALSGSDYVPTSGVVTFVPGDTSEPVTVTLVNDAVVEADETFALNLSGASGAPIGDAQGIATILNDDPQPTVTISDAMVVEGNAGPTTATFTVSLSAASGQTVTVPYSTADGTATAGVDYTAASSSVTFTPGDVSEPISITVSGDAGIEENETFFVNLGAPTNATLGDGQGVGTIVDDDPPPSSLATARDAHLGQNRADTISGLATRSYRYRLAAGRSYAAWCWVPGTDGGGACEVFWRDALGVIVGSTDDSEPAPPGGDTDAVIPTSTDTYYVEVRNPSASPANVRLGVTETTLFSPWFFRSTASGYDGYVEIRNNTDTDITVTVTAFAGSGAIAGTPLTTLVPAAGTLLVVAGSAPGSGGLGVPDDTSGSVQIAHTGMPGAIAANLTTLSASTGLSFDAPFTPRMSR
jgi:glucose/arabinose dehydrogenase